MKAKLSYRYICRKNNLPFYAIPEGRLLVKRVPIGFEYCVEGGHAAVLCRITKRELEPSLSLSLASNDNISFPVPFGTDLCTHPCVHLYRYTGANIALLFLRHLK